MWILIRCLRQKPADLDLQCFQKRINPRSAGQVLIFFLAWEFVMRSCLKQQNPCSNLEIHVLFEHGSYLKKPKLGPDLHA